MAAKTVHERPAGRKRIFHWVIATAFFAMVATGLVIYIPALSALASGGWTRLVHRIGAVVLLSAPLLYALFNHEAVRRWLREAALWKRNVSTPPYVLNTWRRRHKFLLSLGYLLFAITGALQWFLKETVPSSVFHVSIFVHDILFFGAILVLLYHAYFEFYWWLWKRRYCRTCTVAYCADVCPVGAVSGYRNSSVIRDQEKCNNCRLCMEFCRRNAYHRKDVQAGARGTAQ
ncbi:MAG: cytochrome b/b6 domain-containing protein [Chloroflexota bacterium]